MKRHGERGTRTQCGIIINQLRQHVNEYDSPVFRALWLFGRGRYENEKNARN